MVQYRVHVTCYMLQLQHGHTGLVTGGREWCAARMGPGHRRGRLPR